MVFIKNGKNGFILDGNSPQLIAKRIRQALEHPNLSKIIENAYNLVRAEYSYEAVLARYREILYGR